MSRMLLLAVVGSLLLVVACGGGKDDAETVAQSFWSAMEAKDIDKARSLATKDSRESLSIDENADEQEVEVVFGEVTVESDHTAVATTLTSVAGDGTKMSIPLTTIVVQEEGEWRVDASRTMMSMFGGAFEGMMEEMTGAMQESMQELGETMVETMEEGVGETGEEMAEKQKENQSTDP